MPTQREIAEHLDLDQSTVSRLMAELGIDWANSTIGSVRIAYIRRLREQAAGRLATGDLALAAERARLAREQADRVAMQNAQSRRELAPVALLERALANVARQVAGVLEALPVQLRRRSTALTQEDMTYIEEEIARARNLAALVELNVDDVDGSDGDLPGDPLRAEAA